MILTREKNKAIYAKSSVERIGCGTGGNDIIAVKNKIDSL